MASDRQSQRSYDRNMSYGSDILPSRYVALKEDLLKQFKREDIEKAWSEVIDKLAVVTKESESVGSEIVPQINFAELDTISPEKLAEIKRRGCVVIKDIVPDEEAKKWKEELGEYVKVNDVDGFPEDDKQFFMLYWTQPQVLARSHPNVLKTSTFMNNLYHVSPSATPSADIDLNTPLTYADRFRIRHPGGYWNMHKPHIDGGGIERWEDEVFRQCFKDILSGNWIAHDPYDLTARFEARSSLRGRPNQSTVLRTFQGWLALTPTSPGEGTLKLFPDVILSNAYLILRPFFRLKQEDSDPFVKENWEFDISTPIFPGIWLRKEVLHGPRLTVETHPHMRLDKAMVSVPSVNPGDMVFWHCDMVHSVEPEHHGANDSSVMYIPTVPLTPFNKSYIARQLEAFKEGVAPPDFPRDDKPERGNKGMGRMEDLSSEGAKAMGISVGA